MDQDTLLANLLSLGFDLEDGQVAWTSGERTVEGAVNWIVGQRQGFIEPQSATTVDARLTLGPSAPLSTPSANSLPVVPATDLTLPVATKPLPTELPTSRFDAFPERDKQIAQAEENERAGMVKQAQARKQLEREEKKRIMQQIEEDRNTRKSRKGPVATPPTPATSSPLTAAVAATTIAQPTQPSTQSTAATTTVQIRLSSGRAIRHVFSADATLGELIEFIASNGETSFFVIQPFPQTSFEHTPIETTLRQLGLVPNASLAVRNKTINQPQVATPVNQAQDDHNADDHNDGDQMDQDQHLHHGHHHDDHDEEEEEDIEDHVLPAINNLLPHLPIGRGRGLPRGPGNTLGGSENVPPGSAREAVAAAALRRTLAQPEPMETTTLPADPPVQLQPQHHQQNEAGRAASLQAASQRQQTQAISTPQANAQTAPVASSSIATSAQWQRRVGRLETLCTEAVANIVANRSNKITAADLRGLGPDVGGLVAQNLAATGRLDRFALTRLAGSCLHSLKLDTYKFATNELLAAIARLPFLKTLSLREAPYITDKGLEVIKGLKHLVYLDLSFCKLTPNCVKTLIEFNQLESLGLRKIKLSDDAVKEIAQHMPELRFLDLSGCSKVTSLSLLSLKNLRYLRTLHLDDTGVTDLASIADFPALTTLTVARTSVVGDTFYLVAKCSTLEYIDLTGTKLDVEDFVAIRNLHHLKSVGFPDREMFADPLLEYFTDLRWEKLDFSGFVNVTDVGLAHLAGMTQSLRFLMLSGTKITDASLTLIGQMKYLRELHLDRTLITDAGATHLREIDCLEVLSLAETAISDEFLKAFAFRTLSKSTLRSLNLCRTGISDEGIIYLRDFVVLTYLNIDYCQVARETLTFLDGLSLLQPVRLYKTPPQQQQHAPPNFLMNHGGDDEDDDENDHDDHDDD